MKCRLIRYKTKPECAAENQRLIERVFEDLRSKLPDGVRYLVLKLADGTFVHFVETAESAVQLTGLEAFQSFQRGIKDRALEQPAAADATIVGNYRMLRE
jgi:hypothetical protein